MIKSMIENLDELELAYFQSLELKDSSYLLKANHNMITTLAMLNSNELNRIVEDLKDPTVGPTAIFQYKKIKAEITFSLLAERF